MTIENVMLLAAGDPKNGGMIQMVLMGGIILVFWFFMIRPQAQNAKEQKKFIDELQKGAKIVTSGGIHGVIYKVNEDGTLQIEVNPGSYIKMEKSAISMEMTVAINKTAVATK